VNRIAQSGIALLLAAAQGACFAQLAAQVARQNAITLEQQGKLPEAEAAWRDILRDHPSNPEPYAQLGLLEARQEHYKQAIALYQKALQLNSSVTTVRRDLGLAYFKSGDLKGAIREFGILLKDHPNDFQLVTLTGMAYYGLADYKEAVPYLQKAAAVDKQNLPLRLALAHSCFWSKQYPCVMSVYHEILALNADSAEADMLAGEALDGMQDTAGGIAMFRAAIKANPKEPNVHFGLGYMLWAQKEYPEALSEFQAELANDPNHVQSMEYLADTYVQTNQMSVARPLLERVVREDPSTPIVHLDLAIIYTEAGQKQDALRELLATQKLKPTDVNVHWRLARLYRSMGRTAEAKAEFDKAAALNKAHDEENFHRIAQAAAKRTKPSQPASSPATPTAPAGPNQ
jgi:tetratricopeptide (TPR) repeat protein